MDDKTWWGVEAPLLLACSQNEISYISPAFTVTGFHRNTGSCLKPGQTIGSPSFVLPTLSGRASHSLSF